MWINRVDTRIIPFPFQYHAPKTLEETVELLSRYGGEARILAGGTDLLVKIKQRLTEPRHLISLRNLEELRGIREVEGGLLIGASTRLREIEKSILIEGRLPLLHEAVKAIGGVQIRNRGTIGGNLCNASPAADSAVALMVLEAQLHALEQKGKRVISIGEFFKGPGITALNPTELLTAIHVSYPPAGSGWAFQKIGRTSLDIATVNAAVLLILEEDRIERCRIALGAVAPTPVRVHKAESLLQGKKPTPEAFKEASELVVKEISPITDVRATAEYRREASKALVRDALMIAAQRARGG
jgi:carbon-monoxide dehydrogenase medium subunit